MKEIVVIGAGVIGLTTALKIQQAGDYHVTIIAENFPTDPKSIKYTSHWAGAHHVTDARNDKRQYEMDYETFDKMWKMSEAGGEAEGCFLRLQHSELFAERVEPNRVLKAMPNFRQTPKEDLIAGAVAGFDLTTVTIDTPVYLCFLLSKFLSTGGSIVRGHVQHISQIVEGGARVVARTGNAPQTVDALIVCAGLGARALGGVEDEDMYPIRGQTILVRAPWVRQDLTLIKSGGLWSYIIPRRSGDVILGGTKEDNDWYPAPRPETTEQILKDCLLICPELAPPEIRSKRKATVEDLRPLIIEEGVGLRPARKGGIRLETVWVPSARHKAGKIPIVFNCGHGGYGFQSSWGSASIAFELLRDAFATVPKEVLKTKL